MSSSSVSGGDSAGGRNPDSVPPNSYYCHQCAQPIEPILPEFRCPSCNEGFIEEVTPEQLEENETDRAFEAILNEVVFGAPRLGRGRGRGRGRRLFVRGPEHGRGGHHGQAPFNLDHLEALSRLLGAAVQGGGGGAPPHGVIFTAGGGRGGGSPAPGAFNIDELRLDDIVTQFLNQLDPGGGGVPPLNDNEIGQIPETKITQHQISDALQCSICMDDFRLDETVRKLECDHVFHPNCIIPWVRMHGTCPVCRQPLRQNREQVPAGGARGHGAGRGGGGGTLFDFGPFQFFFQASGGSGEGAPDPPAGGAGGSGGTGGAPQQHEQGGGVCSLM